MAAIDAYAPGSSWIELDLTGTILPQGATLILHSLLDDAQQVFTADTFAQWDHGAVTATFNGPAIRAEILAPSGFSGARLTVAAAIADLPGWVSLSDRTICGPADDRVPSADQRVSRTGGECTAWLIDDLDGGFLTAGHCRPVSGEKVYFNVPASTAAGGLQFPPPDDQFLIDQSSIQSAFTGLGNDWTYFGVFPNTNHGLTPRQRYGGAFALDQLTTPPAAARALRVTGYGSTEAPIPATRNQTQQTHTGPFSSLSDTTLYYVVDTTGGNSGSPIIDDLTGRAIGIHTNAGCTSAPNTQNTGTGLNNTGLRAALANPAGVCRSGRTAESTFDESLLFALGDDANNFGPIVASAGGGSTALGFSRRTQLLGGWQGLAWDATERRFLAVRSLAAAGPDGVGSPWLWSISPQGQANPLTQLRTRGTLAVPGTLTGLAFDPGTASMPATLWAIESGSLLRRVLPANGEVWPLATLAGLSVRALEFDPVRRVLWTVHNRAPAEGGPILVRIDPVSGAFTLIGTGLNASSAVASTCADLAFDPSDCRLLTIDQATGDLLRIDPESGIAVRRAAAVGSFSGPHGLANRAEIYRGVFMAAAGTPLVLDRTGNGNRSGTLDPGETDINVWLPLRNIGTAPADPQRAQLVSDSDFLSIAPAELALPPLAPGEAGWTGSAFRVSVSTDAPCGARATARLRIINAPDDQADIAFDIPIGRERTLGPEVVLTYSSPARPIPDNSAVGVSVPIASSTTGTVGSVEVTLDGTSCTTVNGATTVGISHQNVSQLRITLTSPAGTSVSVLEPGAVPSGFNLCNTRFSDDAASIIGTVPAPFSGTFLPAQSLAVFRGEPMAGDWVLRVFDTVAGQTGSLRRFSIRLKPDRTGVPGPTREFTFHPPSPLTIPDNSQSGATATFQVTGIPMVGDVEVRLDGSCETPLGSAPGLAHPRPSDLTVKLIGPDQTTVTLMTGATAGSGITSLCNITFDDDTPTASIQSLVNPPIDLSPGATVRPATPLVAFAGLPGNGSWQLRVVDSVPGQGGTLAHATLVLHPLAPGQCFPPAVACNADFNNSGELGVSDLFAFLDAYLRNQLKADFDGSGAVGLDDLIAYVTAYLTGC